VDIIKKIRRKVKVMEKICTCCKQPIHPKRVEILPNVKRCVACSTVSKKAGITITKGEGDNTYTETIIMEHDEFVKYKEAEAKLNKTIFNEVTVEDEYMSSSEETDEDNALDFTNIGE
jgi:hypothetical protein